MLMWLWNSNPRSSAIVLEGLVRRGDDPQFVPHLVRGLMLARTNGRWGNTQENAWALAALVAYYKKYEAEVPNMTATVAISPVPTDGQAGAGGQAGPVRTIGSARFRGRSSAAQIVRLAMPELLKLMVGGGDARSGVGAGAGTGRGTDAAGLGPGAAAGASEAELSLSRTGTGRLYYTARLQYLPGTALPVSDQGIRIERRYEPVGESGPGPAGTSFAAGDLVRVTLTITLPKERRYVAVSDPLAAGFEAVDSWFQSTASTLAREASTQSSDDSWQAWWRRGGFDFVDKYDDRVSIFATRLSEGRHEFSYLVRATTTGVFTAAGTWAEEMYAPEVNGRSAPVVITIK